MTVCLLGDRTQAVGHGSSDYDVRMLQSIKLSDIRIKLHRSGSIVAKDKGDGKNKILEIFPF